MKNVFKIWRENIGVQEVTKAPSTRVQINWKKNLASTQNHTVNPPTEISSYETALQASLFGLDGFWECV